jgi:1-phosphofructokinase
MSRSVGIATVTLNPAIDQSVAIPGFAAGRLNRVVAEHCDPGGKGVNVASFLADLHFRVAAAGLLGRDNAGAFEQLLSDKAITDAFVRVPGRPGSMSRSSTRRRRGSPRSTSPARSLPQGASRNWRG